MHEDYDDNNNDDDNEYTAVIKVPSSNPRWAKYSNILDILQNISTPVM